MPDPTFVERMFQNPATVWSAFAATFSAIAAWLSYRTNIKNSKEGVRPDIILEGWEYNPTRDTADSNLGEIKIGSIRNVGKGPALQITIAAIDFDAINSLKEGNSEFTLLLLSR
jgi:hypothetical protein